MPRKKRALNSRPPNLKNADPVLMVYDLCPHCDDEWARIRDVLEDGGRVRRDGCTKHRERRLARAAAVAS